MLGNEAMARGCIEAGVDFASAYPGTPSSEIMETLSTMAERLGFHAEWSTNEIVAMEAAAGASFTGLRSVTSMKQNGLNVSLDFLVTLAYSGSGKGGIIVIVADDPGAHVSTNEQDSRILGKWVRIPIMEPATHQEAKDMVPDGFALSEEFSLPVMIRSVTNLAHSRGDVVLGEIKRTKRQPRFDHEPMRFVTTGPKSAEYLTSIHKKLSAVSKLFETSKWNTYNGPPDPSLLIITSGLGWLYSKEAVQIADLEEEVGILKLGTVHPLPAELISPHVARAKTVLFVEEPTPFLEENVRLIRTGLDRNETPDFCGRLTKHIPSFGELNVNLVINALRKLTNDNHKSFPGRFAKVAEEIRSVVPRRSLTFCPGCSHRSFYWSLLRAIKKNGGKGIVTGDIGCYSLGSRYHHVMKTEHCMGASLGIASGLGVLNEFGLDEPVVAVVGDSTFFHACLPALINVVYNQSDVTLCILDNRTTAMTGFQPHPGSGRNAVGRTAPVVSIENIVKSVGIKEVKIADPYDMRLATDLLYQAITTKGPHVLIFRRECALVARSKAEQEERALPLFAVDPSKCGGDKCKVCVEFGCPAWIWDHQQQKARIEEGLCNKCGVCVEICPYKAIYELDG